MVLFPIAERVSKDPVSFLVKSLPRGYDASLMWTPASPSTAVALAVSGAAWGSIAGPGFAISLAVLAIAVGFEWRGLSRAQRLKSDVSPGDDAVRAPGPEARLDSRTSRKLMALAAGLVSFIASIIAAESLGVTIYQAVLPCVALTLFTWMALLRRVPDGARALSKRLDDAMGRMSNQVLLMTTLPSTVVLLSVVGVHPQIGMVVTYSLVASIAQTYPAAYVCLALLLGAALGFNVSPVSATMLVLSSCAGTNSIEVGLKRHWKYALVVLPVGGLLLRAIVKF